MPKIQSPRANFREETARTILTDGHGSDIFMINGTEKEFLEFVRELGWGEIVVTVKDGRPVMAKVIHQDFKFD